mmetsp:Transcript_37561/g.106074  ORF Transcript_37561/g.106074 Transcript_37561/m.106074 type:complete len:284 (-) Transcript_37561:1121-1972(-)
MVYDYQEPFPNRCYRGLGGRCGTFLDAEACLRSARPFPSRSQSQRVNHSLPCHDLNSKDRHDGHHRDASIPYFRALGPAPLPSMVVRSGQGQPVSVVCLQEGFNVAHGDKVTFVDGNGSHVRQRIHDSLSQVVDEDRVGVKRRHTAPVGDATLLGQLTVLAVNFLQSLDVLTDKTYGHCQHALRPSLTQLPDGVVSVRLEPLHGPDPALVSQCVVVFNASVFAFLHDQVHTSFHLLLIWVPGLLNVRLGNAVRAEENLDVLRHGEIFKFRLHEVNHCCYVPGP